MVWEITYIYTIFSSPNIFQNKYRKNSFLINLMDEIRKAVKLRLFFAYNL